MKTAYVCRINRFHRWIIERFANRLIMNATNSSARERKEVGCIAVRAHIILLTSRGYSHQCMAESHDVTDPMIYRWIGLMKTILHRLVQSDIQLRLRPVGPGVLLPE